uniref:Uncharacterized protein n=1 Tax=Cajanus cajan TaxID=3821 RepID=A0A151R2E4_CAJCA|nr:hypothetical protein KK1_042243 [Cajanus cajan]
MQAPHIDHWNAITRIGRYIKKAPGQGLLYEDKGNSHVFKYCDVDWAGCFWTNILLFVFLEISFLGSTAPPTIKD